MRDSAIDRDGVELAGYGLKVCECVAWGLWVGPEVGRREGDMGKRFGGWPRGAVSG